MQELPFEERAKFEAQLDNIAWTLARQRLGLGEDERPYSRYDQGLSEEQARAAELAHLAALETLAGVVARSSADAAVQAAEVGASQADLGEAAGITRQGVARRWPKAASAAADRRWVAAHGEELADAVAAVVAQRPDDLGLDPRQRRWAADANEYLEQVRKLPRHLAGGEVSADWMRATRRLLLAAALVVTPHHDHPLGKATAPQPVTPAAAVALDRLARLLATRKPKEAA